MIRRATEADLPEMRRVFDAARAYMAAPQGVRRARVAAAV